MKAPYLYTRELMGLMTALVMTTGLNACTGYDSVEDHLKDATVYIEAEGSIREPGGTMVQSMSGTGFFVTGDGYIVTNNHVAGASVVRRVFVNGDPSPRTAKLLGISECSDLAVLKIEGQDFPTLTWYEETIEPGLPVFAAGFPSVTGGRNYTLTRGIISTAPEAVSTTWAAVEKAIYHDAQINSGNSGGPLVTQDTGEIVGVNYAGSSQSNSHIAISVNEARGIVAQLKQGIDVNSIGIVGDVRLIKNENDQVIPVGIWVTGVRAGSRADAAGLRPGDLITSIGGINLQDPSREGNYSLRNYCDVLRSNDPNVVTLPITVLRYDAGIVCEGQINGRALQTMAGNGQATDCPVGPGTQPPPPPKTIPETEPNNAPEQAQQLKVGDTLEGHAKHGDAAWGTQDDPNAGEDIYVVQVTQGMNLRIALQATQDFDIYVVDQNGQLVGVSAEENTGYETVDGAIQPGTYYVIVDAWSSVTSNTPYTLSITQI